METEIELKFVAAQDVAEPLAALLQHYPIRGQDDAQLGNIYFDTEDRRLRGWDCGLRVRSRDGRHEQTIKTAGQVVGGLYQRPEYNLPVVGEWPELAAFPTDIWPSGTDVGELQAALRPLFRTDFRRRSWRVQLPQGAEIEVAYDLGQIQADARHEPLCEVELELVRGSARDLFELASALMALGGLRLGSLSKAQRGYRLAGLSPEPDIKRMGFAPVNAQLTAGEALFTVLQYGLNHWQYHEELFMERPTLAALAQLRNGVALLQQAQAIFADLYVCLGHRPWQAELHWLETEFDWLDEALTLERLTAERGHYLRRLHCQHEVLAVLQARQAALPSLESMQALLVSPRYARLVLAISAWLCDQQALMEADSPLMRIPVCDFANQQLRLSWRELHEGELVAPSLDYSGYLSLVGKLRRNLLAGVSFAALYDQELQQGFRLPWLGILHRMEELEHFEVLDRLCGQLSTPARLELAEWLIAQVTPRLLELDQARLQALNMSPYWDQALDEGGGKA